MSEDHLIRNCAPTLAGLKTGSMFVCAYPSKEQLLASLRDMNERLRCKGLRLLPLRYSDHRALIYVYRPKRLSEDLSHDLATDLLKRCGYDLSGSQDCLVQLRKKLRTQEDFPHEIGLFLGYPPEDVLGFMENKSCNCKCCGCWKVYGDEDAAKRKFAQYKKCTRVYCDQWAKGRDLCRLAVPTN